MASAKGGSGKTVLTATFGAFLAAITKKVLIVDADASTNGLTLLYQREVLTRAEIAVGGNRSPKGVFELSAAAWKAEVVELPNGCHLIAATYAFSNTHLRSVQEFEKALAQLILHQRETYDYIIIDAQAGSDAFARVAMSRRISDEVVIVTEYDPMSAAGVERLKGLFREDLTYDRTWVLLNKMLPEFVQTFGDFLEVARYLSPIPWDPEVVRAYARRRVALDMNRGNAFTLATMRTLQSLLGEDLAKEIQQWTAERETAIREPLGEKIADLEKELQGLVVAKRRFLAQRLRARFVLLLATAITAGLAIFVAGRNTLVLKWVSDLSINNNASELFLIAAALPMVAVISFLFRDAFFKGLMGDVTTDEARLSRQQEILESRLREFETLRHADLESLMKRMS
jgi:MinD-like ATPase involved in chromosome partitioning or flagellar assembly